MNFYFITYSFRKQENKPVKTTEITPGLGTQDSGLLQSEANIVKSEKTGAKNKTSVLFDSDSDDDLFSTSAPKQLPKLASKQNGNLFLVSHHKNVPPPPEK